MLTVPPDCLAKPCIIDRPSPEPIPIGLVVKNGSHALATTSGDMPVPVSDTQSDMYWPGSSPRSAAACPPIHRLSVWIVILPPSGMASRALMHRFRTALSSWFGSIKLVHNPAAFTVPIWMAGPTERRIMSSMPFTSAPTSVGFGSSVCRREKASNRWMRVAARRAAP